MSKQKQDKWIKSAGLIAVIVSALGIAAVLVIYFWPLTGEQAGNGTTEQVVGTEISNVNMNQETEKANETMDASTEEEEAFTETEIPQEEPGPEIIEITISAVGDMMLGHHQKSEYSDSFDEYYDTYGVDYFFQNVKDVFEADDFTIGNLECTLTDSKNLRTTKQWNHKGRPEYVDILSRGSVEAVSLGNNHIMDYNEEGVNDTIANLENAGITYAINTVWGDHYGLYETEKGIKIGLVSVNEYYEGKDCYYFLEDGIKVLREQGADLVFALTHWGGDKVYQLEKEQYEMGRWCIDAGYDLVLGCHPHVIQGIECYNGKYIVYSMGNFCYGGHRNPSDKDSMIFQQTFTFEDGVLKDDTDAIRVIPCRLSSHTNYNDYCPVILEGEEAGTLIEHLNSYSEEFDLVFDKNGYLVH